MRRANRESHRLLAIFSPSWPFVSLPSVLVDNAESRFDATLVLFLGAVVAVLCGLVIHRSFVAGAPTGDRPNPEHLPPATLSRLAVAG